MAYFLTLPNDTVTRRDIGSPINTPLNIQGFCTFYKASNNYGRIEYTPITQNNMYSINKNNGKWGDWSGQALKDDLDSGQVYSISDVPGHSIFDSPISFNHTMSKPPIVVVGMYTDTNAENYGNISVAVLPGSITTEKFTARIINHSDNTYAPGITWIALAK